MKIIIMKKISLQKKIFTVFLLVTGLLLSSCSKDEITYDIVGEKTNKVYFNTETQYVNLYKFTVLHTPVSSTGNIIARFPVRCTKEASSELKVSLVVDNSLVENYNRLKNTMLSQVPENYFELSNNILTIPKGKMISSDSVSLSVLPNFLPELKKDGYLIPVKISSVNGSNDIEISSNLNVVYIIISTSWTNCYNSPVLADMTGMSLITPRTGWSATINVSLYSGNLSQMFDGSTSTYWQIRPSQSFTLTVDLNTEYNNITGIRSHTNSTSYNLTKVNVYTSTDGLNWVFQGSPTLSTATTYQYIKFYQPVTARYIRIEAVSWRSTSRIYWAEFDVYRGT